MTGSPHFLTVQMSFQRFMNKFIHMPLDKAGPLFFGGTFGLYCTRQGYSACRSQCVNTPSCIVSTHKSTCMFPYAHSRACSSPFAHLQAFLHTMSTSLVMLLFGSGLLGWSNKERPLCALARDDVGN